MKLRIFLLISLLNIFLLYLLIRPDKAPAPPLEPTLLAPAAPVELLAAKTNTVVRRQFFSWQELESDDYRAYIRNLESIGCPEATIRDIIVAEINGLFEQRRATEVVTGEQQWWRSVPDPAVINAAAARIQQLAEERRAMLFDLLGPNWENTNGLPSGFTAPLLDGPILGKLSAETKEAIRNYEARMNAAVVAAGRSADLASGARLGLQGRAELARILDPAQLEEYLLRYSSIAHAMRNELEGMNVTPDEFRAIFRARDAAQQQYLGAVAAGDTLRSEPAELAAQSEDAVRQALGPERFQVYGYTRDPAFRALQAMTEQLGAPPEAVVPAYQINQAAEAERERLRSDLTLTTEQREAALETMLTRQRESLQRLLGERLYEQYEAARGN